MRHINLNLLAFYCLLASHPDRMLALIFLMISLGIAHGQVNRCDDMPNVEAILLSPQGLTVRVPHVDGLAQVLIHYSINKPVPGVSAGDWQQIITSQTDSYWSWDNPDAVVNAGDTVNGWYQVILNGEGLDCLEQSWIAVADTTTPKPTTEATTPPAPTTQTTQGPTTPRVVTSRDPTAPTPGPTPDPCIKDGRPRKEKKHCNKWPCNGPEPTKQTSCTEYPCLVFEDNFDYLDSSKWEHEITAGGGGNWEFQYYSNNRSNSYVRDGSLYIKPTLTSDKFGEEFLSSGMLDIWGNHPPNTCTGNGWYGCLRVGNPDNIINPLQSARMRTSNSFFFRYGRVETRARMPAGDWIWPAIWLLPRYEEYGMWPTSGEIDLVESRGNSDLKTADGKQIGNTMGGSTLHWGPFFEGNRYEMTSEDFYSDLAENFHDYAVEWNKDGFVFEFDGEEILKINPPNGGFWEMGQFEQTFPDIDNPWQEGDKMAPFDQEFYLIMNVAVGGTGGFFGDDWTNAVYPKPWNNQSPTAARDFWNARNQWYPTWNPNERNGEDAAMVVDYVRVYKMSADE